MKPIDLKTTVLVSVTASVLFFFFFAFATESATFAALRKLGPTLNLIRADFGHIYAHSFGYVVAFIIGAASAFIFIYPITFLVTDLKRMALVSAVVVMPVTVFLFLGAKLDIWSASLVMQPIVGAAMAVAMRPNNSFKPKPLRGSA